MRILFEERELANHQDTADLLSFVLARLQRFGVILPNYVVYAYQLPRVLVVTCSEHVAQQDAKRHITQLEQSS